MGTGEAWRDIVRRTIGGGEAVGDDISESLNIAELVSLRGGNLREK